MTDFSYQLYSSRNFGPLSKTLKMVADLGYKQVEGYGGLYANLDALDQLKADLAENNLNMATGHFGFDMVAGESAKILNIAKELDMKGVFVPAPPSPEYREGTGDWAKFAADLAEASKPYLDAGLTFGYHNHHWEWEAANGTTPIEMLTANEGVQLEMDVAWVVRAGQDPIAWMDKFGSKIVAAHVKDIAPAGECEDEDGWADVGQGTMDWPAIMTALREKTAAKFFVMEHDNPSDDARFAKRSIDAANQL